MRNANAIVFALTLVVMGMIYAVGAVDAQPSASDCCVKGAACCVMGGACCTTRTVADSGDHACAMKSTDASACPMMASGHHKADGDCCAKGEACCAEGAACCAKGETCCAEGAACCAKGEACCAEGKACTMDHKAVAHNKMTSATADCCAEGAACCVEGAACCQM